MKAVNHWDKSGFENVSISGKKVTLIGYNFRRAHFQREQCWSKDFKRQCQSFGDNFLKFLRSLIRHKILKTFWQALKWETNGRFRIHSMFRNKSAAKYSRINSSSKYEFEEKASISMSVIFEQGVIYKKRAKLLRIRIINSNFPYFALCRRRTPHFRKDCN